METAYVIAIKRLPDHEKDIVDHWEYAHVNAGGYNYWSENIEDAEYFFFVSDVKIWLENEKRLSNDGYNSFFGTLNKNKYDLSSLRIKSVVYGSPFVNFVKSLDVDGE